MTLLQQVDAQIGRFHKAMGESTGLYPVHVTDEGGVRKYVYNNLVEVNFRWFDCPELATGFFENPEGDGEYMDWVPYRSKGDVRAGLENAQIAQLLKVIETTLTNMGFFRYMSQQFEFSEAVGFYPCPIIVNWKPLSSYFTGRRKGEKDTEE